MKIIEALKQIKDLLRKVDDLHDKIKQHSAITSGHSGIVPCRGQRY